MKTIIYDIDGTITDMWPIEKSVLLYMTNRKFEKDIESMKLSGISDTYKIFLKFSNKKMSKKEYTDFYNKSFSNLQKNNELPVPEKYPLADWIFNNKEKYRFVYATGGQQAETCYVLESLGLIKYFDLVNSVDRTTCCFSKKTGVPFRKIKFKFNNCVLISDSRDDCNVANLAKIPCVLVRPRQKMYFFGNFYKNVLE